MKLSISLPASDVEFVDAQLQAGRFESRSAVLQAAVRLLRDREHTDSYAAAWDEWDAEGGDLWDRALADGMSS